jgi:AcrR family transcriptional regulator
MTEDKKNKVVERRKIKEKYISDAAYRLFISKGIQDTSIDEIVRDAGIAKGTFYLYFKDKYDILDRIILSKSSIIIREALENTSSKNFDNSTDKIIYFIDYIIEFLKVNKELLRLLYKNLSWGLYNRAFEKSYQYKEMTELSDILRRDLEEKGYEVQYVSETIFIIVELTGTVCYSSIILEEPKSIEVMKPILFKMIRKMLI